MNILMARKNKSERSENINKPSIELLVAFFKI